MFSVRRKSQQLCFIPREYCLRLGEHISSYVVYNLNKRTVRLELEEHIGSYVVCIHLDNACICRKVYSFSNVCL